MAMNGVLAKMIFEHGNSHHEFYLEESYVIPWMYPYMEPAGLIMKVAKVPLPTPQENRDLWDGIVAKDKRYWDELTDMLLAHKAFRTCKEAQKAFSKMRSAIAGIYVYRGMLPESEHAFRQSLQLCPDSSEGNFRLADLYMRQQRYEDARLLMERFLALDPGNANVAGFLAQIKVYERDDARKTKANSAPAKTE